MNAYDTDDKRWAAIEQRDALADGCFVYGVLTTGVYCFPSCPSRTALRENVRFFSCSAEAARNGLRACKRCLSDQPPLHERNRALVERACRAIEAADSSLKIDTLAGSLGVSRFHLSKLFRQVLGITPKAYVKATRARQFNQALDRQATVTDALYEAGYESASAFYAEGARRLGMSASAYRARGHDVTIRYAFGQTRFGRIIVGVTAKGICSVLFGEHKGALLADLTDRFSEANLVEDDQELADLVAQVVDRIENPDAITQLPLDIQGTVFQEKVWSALQRIPTGQTRSYSQIAQQIGNPRSARAVAKACAANPVAVIVPCHRIVRADGGLSGYRWGTERKRQLLHNETLTQESEENG